jgi:hypothetical protein
MKMFVNEQTFTMVFRLVGIREKLESISKDVAPRLTLSF